MRFVIPNAAFLGKTENFLIVRHFCILWNIPYLRASDGLEIKKSSSSSHLKYLNSDEGGFKIKDVYNRHTLIHRMGYSGLYLDGLQLRDFRERLRICSGDVVGNSGTVYCFDELYGDKIITKNYFKSKK